MTVKLRLLDVERGLPQSAGTVPPAQSSASSLVVLGRKLLHRCHQSQLERHRR